MASFLKLDSVYEKEISGTHFRFDVFNNGDTANKFQVRVWVREPIAQTMAEVLASGADLGRGSQGREVWTYLPHHTYNPGVAPMQEVGYFSVEHALEKVEGYLKAALARE